MLNDTNESTVKERNKAITVDSTEIKPAVDDKDLLISNQSSRNKVTIP